MADATQNVFKDERGVTLTRENQQRERYLVETGIAAASDTLVLVLNDSTLKEAAMPSIQASAWTHDGGLSTGATATHVTSDGDTIVFDFKDPDNALNDSFSDGFTSVTHTLDGVTGGAATAAEIVASLNADTAFTAWAYAAVTATNVVTVFPKGPLGQVKIGTGSTSAAASDFAATTADNAARTFTKVDMVDAAYTMTYAAATKTLTITDVAGTAKLAIFVDIL